MLTFDQGRYSVPVLWDKKLGTIVNNESLELLRDLPAAFNSLEGYPKELQSIDLYPKMHREAIDRIGAWMQSDLNTGVYKGMLELATVEQYSRTDLLQLALPPHKKPTTRTSPHPSLLSTPSRRSPTPTAVPTSSAQR